VSIISNTTVLSNFAALDVLDKLRDLYKEIELFSSMPGRLHAGEASCLAIAQHRGWLLLTDDKAARRQAEERKVAVSGTLGCLILGIERGLWGLEQANGWLTRIVALGFRSPVKDLAGLVASQG
jgi:predicted nucleic acid-binding protein